MAKQQPPYTVRLPPEYRRDVALLSAIDGVSQSELIRRFITAGLDARRAEFSAQEGAITPPTEPPAETKPTESAAIADDSEPCEGSCDICVNATHHLYVFDRNEPVNVGCRHCDLSRDLLPGETVKAIDEADIGGEIVELPADEPSRAVDLDRLAQLRDEVVAAPEPLPPVAQREPERPMLRPVHRVVVAPSRQAGEIEWPE